MRRNAQRAYVLLFLLLCLCAFAQLVHAKSADMVPGGTLHYRMQHGDERSATLHVSRGFFARVVVEQRGLDVKVAVLAPSGAQIAWVDRPNAAYGPEAISFIAPESGLYIVKITTGVPFSSAGNIYVSWVAYRPALAEDATRIRAEKLCTEAAALRDSSQQELPQKQAILMFAESAKLWRRLHDPYEIAIALYGEGITARSLGLYADAEQYLRESIMIMHGLRRPVAEAASRAALGFVYFAVGDESKATSCFRKALAIDQRIGHFAGMGQSYYALGSLEFKRGNYQRAAILLKEARKLFVTVGYQRGAALANTRLGAVFILNHQYDQALDHLNTALEEFTVLRDEYGRADALLTVGMLRIQQGRTEQATQVLQQALHYFQSTGNMEDTLSSRFLLARVAIQEHRLSDAETELESLVHDAESIKLLVAGEDERMWYVATIQDYYGLLARTLLDLEKEEQGKGYLLHAFEIFERATSQALIEKMLQQNPDISAGENPLQFRPGVAHDLMEKLPPQSALLGYFLNRYCSCAFVATSDRGIRAFTLSDSKQIFRTTTATVRSVGASATKRTPIRQLRQLSDLLLRPAAPELRERHDIIVVSQGAVDLLPFVLLPDPNSPAKLMVDSHDVMQAPSVSYLAFAQASRAQEHEKELLIFADPVLDNEDPRLKFQVVNSAQNGTAAPFRLVFTRLEAEQITGELRKSDYTKVYGFAFAKTAIQSEFLNRYEYLHFATHTQEDSRLATGGALLLSRFNDRGKTMPYLLTGDEINRLDLTGQVVTLSACRTSAGQQMNGEGIISLTRSFLYAGASSVIASKWVVDDRATVELMGRLYHHLLAFHEPPVRALARAQREMRKVPRWHAPYYWASFSVYGLGTTAERRPQP